MRLEKRRSKILELVQMAYEGLLLAYEHPYQSSQNSGRRVEPVISALTEEVRQMRPIKLCFELGRKLSDDTNKKHRLSLACISLNPEKPLRITVLPVGEVLVLLIVENPFVRVSEQVILPLLK